MRLEGVRHVFIDFDSTLVAVEGLEVLASVVGDRLPPAERDDLERRVRDLTNRAMAGEVPFAEALATRLDWLRPRRADLAAAERIVTAALEPDARETVTRLLAAGLRVHVISGGLRALVLPASVAAGVAPADVHCNDLVFDGDEARSVVASAPLARDGGKAEVVRGLAPAGETVMVGDGATDLEVRQLGAARWFVAHVGIRDRPGVAARADAVIHGLSELVPLLA